MSTSLYQEAIADAKKLREVAEQNAKNAIVEAVTPKIRELIEEQLLSDASLSVSDDDDTDILNEAVGEIMSGKNPDDETVALDETAIMALLDLFTEGEIKDLTSQGGSDSVQQAIQTSISSLDSDDRQRLTSMAKKLSENADNLSTSGIFKNSSRLEESNMSKKDVYYEVDLNDLREAVMADEEAVDVVESEEEDADLKELAKMLGRDRLDELLVQLDIPGVDEDEIDPSSIVASVVPEEDVEEEDLEMIDVDIDDMADDVDVEEEEIDDDEVIEINEDTLRSELRNLRAFLSEAKGKDLLKVKGIAKDMADSWGGKGSGKSGDDFGGGKRGSDPLKVTLNKLSEAYNNERRNNRALKTKLKEYRGAVETLREQLTDLNLFNAKLLYVNKLLQSNGINTNQRKSIVESIDSAKSIREVKLLYRSLTRSLHKQKRNGSLNESARRVMGSSSQVVGRASASEATDEVNRWALLAGLNNDK